MQETKVYPRIVARLRAQGLEVVPGAKGYEVGQLIFVGYWETIDRVLEVHADGSVTVEGLTEVNGNLTLLDRPLPARHHHTTFDHRDAVVREVVA